MRSGGRELPGRNWPAPVHPLWVRWLAWRNETPTRQPSEMGAGVWVGGVPSRRRWEILRARGVTTVIGLTAELPPPAWLANAQAALWLPVVDRLPPSDEQMHFAIQAANEAERRRDGVLFYCGSGLGRAPTVWVAWRLSLGERLGDLLGHLVSARPIADPTLPQREALNRWSDVRSRC